MNELLLNKSIYPREKITAAIRAFDGLCEVALRERDGYLVCVFQSCKYGLDETKAAFENFLIDLINTDSINDT